MSKIRLEEIIPCCWFYCSGSDFDCMALFNLLDIGIISVYSLISLLKKWFGMLIFYGDKIRTEDEGIRGIFGIPSSLTDSDLICSNHP